MITIIAAVAKNGVIGNGDKLPWKIKEEMDFFKLITTDQNLVFGRKTAESVGILKDRNLFCLTKNDPPEGYTKIAFDEIINSKEDYLIGGGKEIYELFIPHAKEMIISELYQSYNGNVYFPNFNIFEWDKYNEFIPMKEFRAFLYRRK